MNGVREILRETFGRSPDPDEVYAEAQPLNGATRTKVKKETNSSNCEDIETEIESQEDGCDDVEDSFEEERVSDDGVGHKSQVTAVLPRDQVNSHVLLQF